MPHPTLAEEPRARPAEPAAPVEPAPVPPVVRAESAAAAPSSPPPSLAMDLLGSALTQPVLAVALPQAVVTWSNTAAAALFGRPVDGAPLADLLVEAADRDAADWLSRCAAGAGAAATGYGPAGDLVPLTVAVQVVDGLATVVLSDRRDSGSAGYAAARASLERYALALRSTNDGIYDWDIETDRIFFSQRAREIFGLASDEMSPHGWAARIHPDDYPAYRAAHVQHLRGETERFVCEYRFRAGDAGWKWVRQHGIALRREGRAIRLTGSVGDISEMKAAEARIERERQILAATIEHMEQGLYMADADGCVVAFNRRFRAMYDLPDHACQPGYTVESVLRFLFERGDLDMPWDQVKARSLSPHSRRHGHVYETRRPGGMILEARTTALPDGGYIRTFTDVTARRKQERAISDILEAIPLPIIVSSTEDSTIFYVNTHAQEDYGLCVGAPVGGNAIELYVNPEDRRQLVERVRRDRVVAGFEVEWTTIGTRDRRWVLLSAHAFTYQGRDAMLVTAADITERRRMDAELKAAKERAEQALADLQATQKSLVEAEKMASLGGLVAGVAHEINTPVGITVTTATHLQEKTRDIQRIFEGGKVRRSDFESYLAVAGQAADLILGSSTRAANLIQSFKQVAVDQTSEERRRFDLGPYVEEVLLSLGPRLKRTPHRVTTEVPAGIIVDSYPGPLSQVLTNFVMNSLMHAWPEDATTAGTMSVRAWQEGAQVVLVYQDNGRGIPADHLGRVFEPFFTTRRGSGGSGLGLNIVFNIVRQTLKGTVDVDSRPGEGTTFTLRFPLEA
ncbi:PAS-domain containing protein [Caenispirillum bisanense]|uniref:PAS-domain containing protein n=1 Tax=Caenispirillum bisanense TaxID=414052 RepID=UPI0031DD411C